MITGTGTDIIETERIRLLMDLHGVRFLRRWFTDEEIAYCIGKAKPHLHFAARLAAKEAAFKALKLSEGPLRWKDIAVAQDKSGRPFLVLAGTIHEEAERTGINRLHLSISHCDAHAIATVIAERDIYLEPETTPCV